MPKKIKPNKLLDIMPSESGASDENLSQDDSQMPTGVLIDKNSILGEGRLTKEAAEKLEKFDAMEKSLAQLSQEKNELEQKVAEYIEKLENASSSSKDIDKLNAKIKSLEEKCKKLENGKKDKDVDKLEKEIKSLKDENDSYLVKISELTFENAKLTCQLSELSKKPNNANVQRQAPYNGLASPMKDAYNPYINNGYGTW